MTQDLAAATTHTYVDPYPGHKGTDRVREECGKCGGAGSVEWGAPVSTVIRTTRPDGATTSRHVGRVCFDCDGYGHKAILVSSARARVRRHVKEANERAAQNAAAEAEVAAHRAGWLADNAELVDALAAMGEHSEFAADLASKAKYRPLTDAQMAAARQALARHDEAANAAPIEEGRRTLVGRIVSTRIHANDWGINLKVLVDVGAGHKVWGNVPGAIAATAHDEFFADGNSRIEWGEWSWADEALRGRDVQFDATVTRSDRDPAFGFFKRPTKASLRQ